MDPLSITASSAAVVTICSQVTTILSRWISGVHKAESTLGNLDREVVALSTTLESVSMTFQRPALVAIIKSDNEATLWSSIAGILKSCKLTMRRLRWILRDLDSRMGGGNIFRKALLYIRLGSKADDIAALLRKMQAYTGMLQVNVQCASVCIALHKNYLSWASEKDILGQLQTIRKDIRKLSHNINRNSLDRRRQSTNSIRESSSPRIAEPDDFTASIIDYIHSTETFINESASTVYSQSTTCSELSQRLFSEQGSTSFLEGKMQEARPSLDRAPTAEDMTSDKNKFVKLNALKGEERVEAIARLNAYLYQMDIEDIAEAAYNAIWEHEPNVLRLLIEYGLDVNKDYKGLGPVLLHTACYLGYEATVKVLLESGADINAKYMSGELPVQFALINGHDEIACLLISRVAETNFRLNAGSFAILSGEIMSLDPNNKDLSILYQAAAANCVRTVQLLIDRGDDGGKMRDSNGFTALHEAAFCNSWQAATILIDHGFDIEARTMSFGLTPLIMAAYNPGRYKIDGCDYLFTRSSHEDGVAMVKLLLDRGADVNAVTLEGEFTALDVAVNEGNFAVVRLLKRWKERAG